jgi:HD-like signal output (HDOD) protein
MLSFNNETVGSNISDVHLGRGIQLPLQPKVLVEFQELICRGDFSIRELAIVVGRDPGITTSLFRVVSSPIFHCSKRCDSVEQVMTILGAKQTFSLVQAVARHWKLPEFICRDIQYHHEMPSAELGAVRTLVAILHLAIHFYNISSGVADTVWRKVGNEVLVEVGIDPQGESAFYDEVMEKFLACKV